jgi:D-alanyl-D-alanine carboxypeptidase
MQRLVIGPLALRHTMLTLPPGVAQSYRGASDEIWPSVRRPYQAAAGGYFSTAPDLLRFARLTYGGGFLSAASRAALTHVEVPSDSYALGGRVRQLALGARKADAAWDTGNTAGFRSVLGFRLDGEGSVVVLDNGALPQRTMDAFAEALLQARA